MKLQDGAFFKKVYISIFFFCFSFLIYSQQLVINELMPSNLSVLTDNDGDTPDWIELYNADEVPINIGGFGLSDNDSVPFRWTFPSMLLGSKEYLLLFASGKDRKDIPLHWETIIDWGDNWKYLLPSAELPSEWTTTSFDDSSWDTGKSGFGYSDNDDSTIINATISVFIRKSFTVSTVSDCRKAILSMDYDDAFIAYLNGFEIARSNIGTNGIPSPYNQKALSNHEAHIYNGGKIEEFLVDSVFNFLQEGENILAIQIHNVDVSSSDLTAIPLFTLGLTEPLESPEGISTYLDINPVGLHTNFKINASKETIYLTDSTGILLDSLQVSDMRSDISIGRKPDGSDTLFLFDVPTPGKPNQEQGFLPSFGKQPLFSHDGGIYQAGFNLGLNANTGDTIYYTTDGSEPQLTSMIYTNPLYINKSKVIRARILNHNELPGDIITNTYIIINRTIDMPVVSISTAPENLWDTETGIYVKGNNAEPNEPYYGANYWMDWEKPAHIEFFEPGGTLGFEMDAGIKIFGAWSRSFEQKSLSVFARKKYGENEINYQLFSYLPINTFEAFLLRNSGNDFLYTGFRDAFHTSLTGNSGVDHQAYRPAVVFINGEYWGIQNIREKINEHFIASHHNVNKNNMDMLEYNGSVIHGSNTHYNDMISYINSHSLSNSNYYEYVRTKMDIDNYINYLLLQIYIDNKDWPGNNIKYWREQSLAGKWRWILFDTDFGFGIWDVNKYTYNTLQFVLDPYGPEWPNPPWSTFLFRKLIENHQFTVDFINCFADNLNTIFQPVNISSFIEYFKEKYSNEMPYHLSRWNGSYQNWLAEIENMKIFGNNRISYVRGHIVSEFGLKGTHKVILKTSNYGSGKVKLNSITPFNYPWGGVYFDNIPIQLTAKPEPGYRFVRWGGNETSTSPTITVNVLSDIELTAYFEEDGSKLNSIIINEINYHSVPGNSAGDWIELYNRGEEAMDISFWKIKDSDDLHFFLIPQNMILNPGEYLVICRDSTLFQSQYGSITNYVGNLNFGLASAGECVRLYNYANKLVDSVYYKPVYPWPENANGTGHSLALKNPSADNTNPISWLPSSGTGTPGSMNDIFTSVDMFTNDMENRTDELFQNYPNPFSTVTTIQFTLNTSQKVKISLYNLSGQLIDIFTNTYFDKGEHELIWSTYNSGKEISPGIYLIKMETNTFSKAIKTAIIR